MKSLDSIFRLLAPERRRFALYYLTQQDRPVRIEELAEQLAEWEREDSAVDVPDEDLRDIAITLRHNHLPKVEDAEFIEYDADHGVVRVTDTSRKFDAILSVTRALERPEDDDIASFL